MKTQRLRVYYAHSMGIYNTPQETRDIETLMTLGFEVLNPNKPQYSKMAKERGGMDVFRDLVQECDVLAFRAHVDMLIGSGVGLEIEWAEDLGMPIIELPSRIKHRTMDIATTREYLREVGQR